MSEYITGVCVGRGVIALTNPGTQDEDHRLVGSALAGDERAREDLGRRVGRSAYVFALQIVRDREVALDIAQDGVLRFFSALDRFDADRPIDPWLYQIVRNQARDRARRERLRNHDSLEVHLEAGGAEGVTSTDDPVRLAESSDLQRRIWRAVSDLSDAQREIFVLRDHHGLSYREIADVLSIPSGTVMSRLHAARTRLRELLAAEREGGER